MTAQTHAAGQSHLRPERSQTGPGVCRDRSSRELSRGQKVGLGQPHGGRGRGPAQNPGCTEDAPSLRQQAPHLSGIQLGERVVFILWAVLGWRLRQGQNLGSARGGAGGTGGGINEMPLGAKNSLIGATSRGAAALATTHLPAHPTAAHMGTPHCQSKSLVYEPH